MKKIANHLCSIILGILPLAYIYQLIVTYENYLAGKAQGGSAPFSTYALPVTVGYIIFYILIYLFKNYLAQKEKKA